MRAWLPLMLRALLLVLLLTFLLMPESFDPILRPLVQQNAPAIYNQGSLLTLTLLHLRTVAIATTAAILVAVPMAILVTRPIGAEFLPLSRGLVNIGQTFPPVAVLALAVPTLGFGEKPTLVALFLYGLLPIFENTLTGLTTLPPSVMEAARGTGMTGLQRLFKVELPLATPTIMAGINQVIMLSLSMVVIAGMVGAGGLGGDVVKSLSRIDAALGFEAGISVVILAIFLDRVTASLGRRSAPGAH